MECHACELIARRDRGEAPPWDRILRTERWDVVHAFGTTLEGWLVLVPRRHVFAVADLTDDEAADLGPLVKRTSRALHEVTGCIKTYVVQFAEDPRHQHVHVHVIPRQVDHPQDLKGPDVFRALGVDAQHEVSEDRRNELAHQLSATMTA